MSLFFLSMKWAHLDVRSGHCPCIQLPVLTESKTLEASIVNDVMSFYCFWLKSDKHKNNYPIFHGLILGEHFFGILHISDPGSWHKDQHCEHPWKPRIVV